MFDRTTIRRHSLTALFAALFLFAGTRPARAQGFISPFIGYNFGGDAGCPEITNCQDKRTDYGVSIGALGSIVGFEEELGYTKNFFGEHVGLRGDVRYFHSFQVLDFLNLQNLPIPGLGGKKLDYGRAAAAIVFKF